MLILSVILYMLATLAIGVYASRRVHGASDFMVAGRSLPFSLNFACVFATWFGAESLLSVSAKFAHQGVGFISGDPFGATFCLVLVAIFFARPFYRLGLMTIGDYYHQRFGKAVEVVMSLAIAISYISWTSAQLAALGLVLNVLFPSGSMTTCILWGSAIVTVYTMFGGMWSVAWTDLIQTVVIVVGLLLVAMLLGQQAGGVPVVIEHAYQHGKLNLFPHLTIAATMNFIGEFITVACGSIPQQDVFQRVTSAKNERTAILGTLTGGLFYLGFAFIPMFIAYAAVVMDPDSVAKFGNADLQQIQKILPELILNKTPVWCQILFFGALLSAILSTASGTLLGPASILAENVLQPFTKHLNDTSMLRLLRTMLVGFAGLATYIAVSSKATLYDLVQNSNNVTLVVGFVPLVAGMFWSKATTQGAVLSIGCSLPAWLLTENLLYQADSEVWWICFPPQLYGLAGSLFGMVTGSLLPQWIGRRILGSTGS